MDYMWEEYELTYSHALEMRKEELLDPVLLKKEIQRLKQRLKRLAQSMSMRLRTTKCT